MTFWHVGFLYIKFLQVKSQSFSLKAVFCYGSKPMNILYSVPTDQSVATCISAKDSQKHSNFIRIEWLSGGFPHEQCEGGEIIMNSKPRVLCHRNVSGLIFINSLGNKEN